MNNTATYARTVEIKTLPKSKMHIVIVSDAPKSPDRPAGYHTFGVYSFYSDAVAAAMELGWSA